MKPPLSLTARGRILHRYLKELEENVVLAEHLGFRVGGVADYFFRATTVDQLISAAACAIFTELPYVVFGQGSQTLVSDTGFPGLAIKNEVADFSCERSAGQVVASSGLGLSRLATLAAEHGLSGLESAVGRRGTLGGHLASIDQAESRLDELVTDLTLVRVKKPRFQRSDPLEMVEIVTLPMAKFRPVKPLDHGSGPVILTAKLKLRHRRSEIILAAMSQVFDEASDEQASFRLLNRPEVAVRFGRETISVAELMRRAGLEGFRETGVILRQGRLINQGEATAETLRRVAETAKLTVRQKYGAILEETFSYVGRW